jgi:subtilisin family serine protease
MKKVLLIASCALFIISCKKDLKNENVEDVKPIAVKSITEINAFIKQKLEADGKFEWSTASDEIIWSALQQSDNIASVGYKPSNEINVENNLHNINIANAEWQNAKQKILQIIFDEEIKTNKDLQKSNMEIWPETILPLIDVEIKNLSTIKKLRASSLLRYVEPMSYEPGVADGQGSRIASSSGCSGNPASTSLVNNVHYTVAAPNVKVSWNYAAHGIQNAWTKSTGSGVKVFFIDTGCEYDQENLGSAFNQGASSGRTVEKIVTLPRSTFLGFPTGPVEIADDGCGHGTSMAGACAAPRGTDGASVGVAYNCNLVTCRAAEDVLIDGSREVKGVSDAYVNAANRTDVKIISMSLGRITGSSQITDAIRYANGKGKLMFCAGGTSFSWSAGWFGVIFPAWLPEVQAITGVKQNTAFTNCESCHKGSEIDFVVVMERTGDNEHALTLASSGDAPATVGGSSVATATTAGMAALVWARFPSFTAAQVLDKLKASSSNYPNKTAEYGWGKPNVDIATN